MTIQRIQGVEPITEDDAFLEKVLEHAHIPSLMCALVHITGDADLIRGDIRPEISFFGDEQGGILLPDGAHLPLGSVLTAMTPHCDPTVNLYDNYYVVKEDRLADIWPIEARGRSA